MDNNKIIKRDELNIELTDTLKVGSYIRDSDHVFKVKEIRDNGTLVVDRVNPLTLEPTGEEWYTDYTISESSFKEYYQPVDAEKLRVLAQRLINGEQIEEFEESGETALMSLGNKSTLMILKENIERANLVATQTKKYAQIIIKNMMKELEKKIEPMNAMIEKMNREVKRLNYVIATIETYAGIKESVIVLKTGDPAPETEPIVFRQAVIFMDEEIALIDDDFDWQKMDKFDKWILENDRFKEMMPEPKSMIAIKPRRTDKTYSFSNTVEGHIYNWSMNQPNKQTMFLIRNGENLYKLESEHIVLDDKMFPNQDEYAKIIEEEQKDIYYEEKLEKDELKSGRFRRRYTNMAFLMQGLIERSDVFAPHTVTGSLIKMEGFTDEQIELRYELDFSRALPDGRPTVDAWLKQMNEKLCEGKRIVLVPQGYSFTSGYWFDERHDFLNYYKSSWTCPDTPGTGIYTLCDIPEDRRNTYFHNYDFLIKYMPSDDVRGYWEDTKRKNKVSIRIDLSRGGVLNYDDMDMDDVDYYLNSRIHRSKYYMFVRLLKEYKKIYESEKEAEKNYTMMMIGEIIHRDLVAKPGYSEGQIVEIAITAIKDRLKWKRPITAKEKETHTMISKLLFSKEFIKKYFDYYICQA